MPVCQPAVRTAKTKAVATVKEGKKEMERLAATKAMGVALWPQNFLTVARFCQKMSH